MGESEVEVVTEDVDEDHVVPTDLLELHVALEDADVTPEDFKEVYGNEAGN